MIYPKISIVTPSFNQGKYLEETILSIINQKYPNLEYIVIDGGSTDNSVEIIKKYHTYLNYWVSEKDKGQSDAINKGLKRVSGDLFNWINSDDLLEEGALFEVAKAYRLNTNKKVFCFGLNYLAEDKKERFEMSNDPINRIKCFCDPVIAQPATFLTMEAVKEMGELNLQLHYSMDYEWWLKLMFLYGEQCVFTGKEAIASFRIHKESKTANGNEHFVEDMASILCSLTDKAGLNEYHNLLTRIFTIHKKYEFEIFSEKIDKNIVTRMAIYFLLKWKNTVYTKKDFFAAKMIIENIKFEEINLSRKEQLWLDSMKKNSEPSTWLEFCVRRKIKYVFQNKV